MRRLPRHRLDVRWLGRWIVLSAVLCAGLGCRPQPPPLVLVSIDTLRSDHLPAYGYDGVATPALDRLAADGVVYERAWSHYPLTFPSHASIFSGRLPPQHGVRDNSGYRFPAESTHLARDLAAGGYRTGGAVSAFVLRGETGLGDGFELYDDDVELRRRAGLGGQQRAGEETLRAVLPWLRGVAEGEAPFFLFLHLYEPHSPYAPPPRFAAVPSRYDGEIAAADAVVGELLGELRRLGVYDRALIVLLSDHGEGLGDHGEAEHGVLLYREALQVPLIVKWPRGEGAGGRVAAAAQLVDVYPTLLGAAGLSVAEGLPGRSLRRLGDASESRPIYAETFYPRLHFGWSELASVVRGDLHYVHGPRPQLFDLARDPAERRDVLAERRRDYAALRRLVEARMTPLESPLEEDDETARRLAALGYLGGMADAQGPRPDPRSRLPVLADLDAGMGLAAEDRFPEAVGRLSAVVEAEPGMVDAWEALARAQRGAGRLDEAARAYRKALDLAPTTPQLALGLAEIFLEQERYAEAEEHAELALGRAPVEAREVLARLALARQDPVSARRLTDEARALRDDDPTLLLLDAEVLVAEGKPEPALAELGRAAAAAASPPPGLDRLRGHVLARLGRAAEAEAAFEAEIARNPREPRAYCELSLLLALQGRPTESVAVLRRLVAAAETPRSYAAAVRTLRVLGDDAGAEALRRYGEARLRSEASLHRGG